VFEWFERLINLKIKVMMSPESLYIAEQEYHRFEEIMNTKEYLTKEEYDFCFAYDKDIREDMSYIGDSNGAYLNLRLYSEHDHEKRGYEMEMG
tara:strand:+ start:4152 stop:4430 length:279 start_codon:yes stop_codon:yes gene_type:complete